MYAGEMVGKMTRAKSNDEENHGHDEEDDQAKKAFGVNFFYKRFSRAHVRLQHRVIVKLDEKYAFIKNNFMVK